MIDVKRDPESAAVSDKMKALLALAGQVQRGGKEVTAEAVARARDCGASDMEIHDTVLIAAAFCMFNRYVDGLGNLGSDRPKCVSATRPRHSSRRIRELDSSDTRPCEPAGQLPFP